MTNKRSKHIPARKAIRLQFLGISLLSVAAVFVIALLSRSELRLSGEVLGAGDSSDLARLFMLRDCTRVERIQSTEESRFHILTCAPYDYLVESKPVDGVWEVTKIERVHD
ncbi:MAG TPA: hypothetical protein VJB82_00885 [Candidatus Peribacterales bacterium]|nr:hypothetical protein [Candidatus Peribacterales bacterium]